MIESSKHTEGLSPLKQAFLALEEAEAKLEALERSRTEPIAIIGNSGELTTGPHLHFELWYNGTALNPEEYITF